MKYFLLDFSFHPWFQIRILLEQEEISGSSYFPFSFCFPEKARLQKALELFKAAPQGKPGLELSFLD